mgnify:CR=1 FL=1|tara:strand:- start:609 stop:719 length:111 start_codon:yes stop_codon:yes gene_type:complete
MEELGKSILTNIEEQNSWFFSKTASEKTKLIDKFNF